jgi:hypothetical protein
MDFYDSLVSVVTIYKSLIELNTIEYIKRICYLVHIPRIWRISLKKVWIYHKNSKSVFCMPLV